MVFLTERVHIVHNATYNLEHWYHRFQSGWFSAAALASALWRGVEALFIAGMSALVEGGQFKYTLANYLTSTFGPDYRPLNYNSS